METKIHVMHTGSVDIDISLAFREKTWHPAPYTGWFRSKTKRVTVPVSCYLIEHSKGLVLVDTGWNEAIRDHQKQHLGALAYSMYRGHLPAGQAVHEQLQAKGIHARDLDYVVLSHLHSDHVSGVKHVTDAKRIIVSEFEWNAAQKDIGYVKSMWDGVDLTTFHLEEIPVGPHRLGMDLFQDGTLYLVHTPGHSKGQISILVLTERGWVLLASDVGYAARSWESNILPGLTTSDEEAQRSLDWVRSFAAKPECIATLANHDPAVTPGIIEHPTFALNLGGM